jgi:hypothetical protein
MMIQLATDGPLGVGGMYGVLHFDWIALLVCVCVCVLAFAYFSSNLSKFCAHNNTALIEELAKASLTSSFIVFMHPIGIFFFDFKTRSSFVSVRFVS